MWDKITRFATDRVNDIKNVGGKISNEMEWAAKQLAGSSSDTPDRNKRAERIKAVTGVKPNLIDPNQDPSIVRAIAPHISKGWGHAAYANPLNNTIAIPNYKPGEQPFVEAHEAGHLSWEDAGPAKFLGVSGRAVTGISDQIGNPPLLEAIGGGLLHFDAAEEDRAERLSAKYGPQLGGKPENAPVIDSDGRSRYGDRLRQEGNSRLKRSVQPFVSAFNTANQWITEQKQETLQPQIKDAVLNYRRISAASNDITPELIEQSKKLSKLEDQYGDGYLDFINTIK